MRKSIKLLSLQPDTVLLDGVALFKNGSACAFCPQTLDFFGMLIAFSMPLVCKKLINS
jgi:hypothetical protein